MAEARAFPPGPALLPVNAIPSSEPRRRTSEFRLRCPSPVRPSLPELLSCFATFMDLSDSMAVKPDEPDVCACTGLHGAHDWFIFLSQRLSETDVLPMTFELLPGLASLAPDLRAAMWARSMLLLPQNYFVGTCDIRRAGRTARARYLVIDEVCMRLV